MKNPKIPRTCEYSVKCTIKPSYFLRTKSGDFFMCTKHARIVEKDRHTRYVEKIRNPGAAWHKKKAEFALKQSDSFPQGHTQHERWLGEALGHDLSEFESRKLGMPNPNKKHKKPSRLRQTTLGTFGGIMLAGVAILGIAWLAEKAKESQGA